MFVRVSFKCDVVVRFDCDSMCGVVWLVFVCLCVMCVFACVVHSFV